MKRPMVNAVLPYVSGCKIVIGDEIYEHDMKQSHHKFIITDTCGKGMPALTKIASSINSRFGSNIIFEKNCVKDAYYILIDKDEELEAAYAEEQSRRQ